MFGLEVTAWQQQLLYEKLPRGKSCPQRYLDTQTRPVSNTKCGSGVILKCCNLHHRSFTTSHLPLLKFMNFSITQNALRCCTNDAEKERDFNRGNDSTQTARGSERFPVSQTLTWLEFQRPLHLFSIYLPALYFTVYMLNATLHMTEASMVKVINVSQDEQ